MKILLSAFAFAPNQGSESGVGWRWAIELARDHAVTVITDATRRALVEPELARHPQPGLTVLYYRPTWLARVPLNSTTAPLLYTLWQFGLIVRARGLHAVTCFDVAMHLTYGVFRHPSFLGYLGIPFIFGPLGGGEDVPLVLKRSIRGREKFKELLRMLVNRLALFDPFLWLALAKTDFVLTKTEDTRQALPWPFRRRAIVFPEIGIDAPRVSEPSARQPHEPLQMLFAGRLVGWKGAHLALRAVALARGAGIDVRLTMVGRGPYESQLRLLCATLRIESFVNFRSHLPQQELFVLYCMSHGFLFPSLHDSSGNVVLEAQAFGCPVICLDCGGPATLVRPDTAIVVATTGANEAEVVQGLAHGLFRFATDEPARIAMARAAAAHARAWTWRRRVLECMELLRGPCGQIAMRR